MANEKMNIQFRISAIDNFSKTMDKLHARLTSAERHLKSIRNQQIKIDADTGNFDAKIKKVQATAEAATRKRTVNIDADVGSASASLTALRNAISRVEGKHTATINANTASANSKLTLTQRLIERIKGVHVVRIWLKGYEDFRKRTSKMAQMMQNLDEMFSGFGRGFLMAMSTTVGPALAVVAGGLGAVGAAAVSAAGGLGIFGVLAFEVSSRVIGLEENLKKNGEEFQKLPKYMQDAILSLKEFKSVWKDFRKTFNEPIYEIFTITMQGITRALEQMKPAVASTTDAMYNLAKSFKKNVESDDVKRFFEWMGETAGPYVEKLTKAVGNFIVGFANMMVAFDPLAQDFSDAFLEMSEDFRKWSATLDENQAFQDFIDFVRDTTPLVLDLLGSMVDVIIEFSIAMRPVAEVVLETATAFFQWLASIFQTYPGVAQFIGIVITLIGTLKVLFPILNMLKLLFDWIVMPIWNAGKSFLDMAKNADKGKISLKGVGRSLLRFIPYVGPVMAIVLELANVFNISWTDIANITQEVWGMLPEWITGPLEGLWEGVTSIFGGIKDSVSTSTSEAATSVQTNFDSMNSTVSTTLPVMDSTASLYFANMANTAGMQTGLMASNTSTNLGLMDTDFDTKFSSMEETVDTSLLNMNSYAATRLSSMQSTTSSSLGLMETDFDSSLPYMDSMVDLNFENMDSVVDSYMSSMSGEVSSDLGTMKSDFSSNLSSINSDVNTRFGDISSTVSHQMNLVSKKINTSLKSVGSNFSKSLTVLNKSVSASFKTIANTASRGMNRVSQATAKGWTMINKTTSSSTNSMNRTISKAWTLAIKSTRSSTSKINSTAHTQFNAMYKGVNSYMRQASNSVRSNWAKAVSYLRRINLYPIGAQAMQGFINGVNSKRSGIISAVSSAAKAAVRAAKSALRIHSPSRVFKQIGEWTGEGLIVGMESMYNGIRRASERMSEAVILNYSTPATPEYLGGKTVVAPRYRYDSSQGSAKTGIRDEVHQRMTIEVPVYLNGRQIARASTDEISEVQQRRKNIRERFRG